MDVLPHNVQFLLGLSSGGFMIVEAGSHRTCISKADALVRRGAAYVPLRRNHNLTVVYFGCFVLREVRLLSAKGCQ